MMWQTIYNLLAKIITPTLTTACISAHIAWGMVIVLTATHLWPLWIAWVWLGIWVACKEFAVDPYFEKDTIWWGGLEDAAGYLFGGAVATVFLLWQHSW